MRRLIRGFAIGAVLGTIAAAGAQDAFAADCTASLSIQRERTEKEALFTRHVFAIDVSVPHPCAVVEFDVILETRKAGEDTKTVKKYRKVRYRTRQLTTSYTYTADPDVDVLSWKVQQTSCQECQ